MKATSQKATEKDKEIITQMANQYFVDGRVQIKQAYKDHPEWKEQLKDVPYSTIGYHLRQIRIKSGRVQEKGIKKHRKEQTEIVPARQEIKIVEKVIEKEENDPLSYCPCCGRYLVNLRNAMMLEEQGKI